MKPQDFGSDRTVRLLGDLAVRDADPLVRARAALDLGQTHNPNALGLLRRALSDGDGRVRSAAALALCNFTGAGFEPALQIEAVGLLAKSLTRGDGGAIRAARYVKQPALAGPLAELANHADPSIRADALNALTELGKAAGTETLRRLLADSDAGVRLAAARNAALGRPEKELSAALAKLAQQDLPAIRGRCLAALGRLAPADHLDLLLAGGKDSHPLVRQGAVVGLASAGRGEKIGAFLKDASTPVRLAAVRAAGRLRLTGCIDRLFEIMLDAEPAQTHLAARDALAEIAAPEIPAAAGRQFVKMRQGYFELLGLEKDKMPSDERRKLRRRVRKVRRGMKAFSYLLGAAGSTCAYEEHLDLLSRLHVQDPLLEQLAVSLGQIGDRRAVGPLIKQMTACAEFSENALLAMWRNPDIKIELPEDNSAGIMQAAVALKATEAVPVMIRFSSMGFGLYRLKRSGWTADMLMPPLAKGPNRHDVIDELRKQLRRRYAPLRCRFESAKSLGRLKAAEAIKDLRWILTEDRKDRRVMFAAAWAVQEITGAAPPVGLPKPRGGDWIIKDY